MELAKEHLLENSLMRFEKKKKSVEASSPDSLSEVALYLRNVTLLKGKRYQGVMVEEILERRSSSLKK